MSAAEAMRAAQDAGVTIGLKNGNLVLEADEPPPDGVLNALSRNKTGIVALLRADAGEWPAEEWQAFYDERAGIAEFDGGLSRVEAETIALACCISEWLNQNPKRSSPEQCLWCGENQSRHDPLVPFGTETSGHAWLHHRCWDDWHASRRSDAVTALSAIGLGNRSDLR